LNKEEDLINNNREEFHYKFNEIFDYQANQEEIFDKVGKGVVEQALKGINGTIFAYGQSGSGKTFTITGGNERYRDRGREFFCLLIQRIDSQIHFIFI
jgi:kinesin family protein 6/9